MDNELHIIDRSGLPLKVRLVQEGDTYGQNGFTFTHTGTEPIIEFYHDGAGSDAFIASFYHDGLMSLPHDEDGFYLGSRICGGTMLSPAVLSEVANWALNLQEAA